MKFVNGEEMAKIYYDKYMRNSDKKVFFLYKIENYNEITPSKYSYKKSVEKGKLFSMVDVENIGNVKIETEESFKNNYTKMQEKYEL